MQATEKKPQSAASKHNHELPISAETKLVYDRVKAYLEAHPQVNSLTRYQGDGIGALVWNKKMEWNMLLQHERDLLMTLRLFQDMKPPVKLDQMIKNERMRMFSILKDYQLRNPKQKVLPHEFKIGENPVGEWYRAEWTRVTQFPRGNLEFKTRLQSLGYTGGPKTKEPTPHRVPANPFVAASASKTKDPQWTRTDLPLKQFKGSHFEVLDLPLSASAADVRKAFLKLALKYHPDKGGHAESYNAIQNANHVLSDDASRYQHIADLQQKHKANFARH